MFDINDLNLSDSNISVAVIIDLIEWNLILRLQMVLLFHRQLKCIKSDVELVVIEREMKRK